MKHYAAMETDHTAAVLLRVDPTTLVDSPYQLRTDLRLDEDFVGSVRDKGILQPIVARRIDVRGLADVVAPDVFEIMFGHRRRGAAVVTKTPFVEIIVRDGISDTMAREIVLIENLHRDDLTPLEECNGYTQLYADGWTVEAIAAKVNKSVAHIARRMGLRHLSEGCKKMLADGRLTTVVAEIIARIPNGKLQDEAARALCATDRDACSSGPAALEHVRMNFMLRLQEAQFDTTDAALVKDAGACANCPKRTGQQAELFADVGSPDLCTDPTCYSKKQAAHAKVVVAAAKKKGLVVLKDEREVESLVNGYGSFVQWDETHPDDPKKRTWGQLAELGRQGETDNDKIVIGVSHRDGRVVKGAKLKDLNRWIEAGGALKTPKLGAGSSKPARFEEGVERAHQRMNEQEKLRKLTATLALEELATKAGRTQAWSLGQWRAFAMFVLSESHYGSERVARRRGADKALRGVEALEKLIKSASEDTIRGLVVELAAASTVGYGKTSTYNRLCEAFGVDLKAKERAARGNLRERKKAKAKKLSLGSAKRGRK